MPPNTVSEGLLSDATRSCIITEDDFQELIKQGNAVFIYESKVYKINSFLMRHPGGEAALRSALGRDVTDEIRTMHPPKVYENMINLYYIGDYIATRKRSVSSVKHKQNADNDKPVLSATWEGGINLKAFDGAIESLHKHHSNDLSTDLILQHNLDYEKTRDAFRRLEAEIRARGLFQCNYWKYAKESCRYILFIFLSLWFTLKGTTTWHYLAGAVFMAMFWHQLVFTAHDAGHNAITGKSEIDHVIGVIIADFIGGLSLGWWKDNHNVHHIVTNHPEHDPDIQHLPFFAITTKFFNNLYSTYYKRVLPFDAASRFFIRHQHHLYYLILSFGRFNLHRLSFVYLFTSRDVRTRKLELIGITCFFIWFGVLLSSLPSWKIRLAYILISYMLTFPLHVQITLSHFGMSTEDKGPQEPFPAKMLRTTMDVDCPEWFDWFHGGLQYQAVHHLFPRLPRHNLRQCVPLVKEFCNEVGLHYYMYNFSTGNGVVLGALKSIADQVSFMNDVAKSNADIWAGRDEPTKKK
ncbi:MAG: delta-6 fatty acid desaturase [Benjaminiella poitrasii]|nr:MAG: delta-6 fatty acid desaturase [Benjaminiella poitrasii]